MTRLSIYTITATAALLAASAAAKPSVGGLRGSSRPGGRRLEEQHTFYNPRWNDLRVDYCYSEMKGYFDGCGKQVQ